MNERGGLSLRLQFKNVCVGGQSHQKCQTALESIFICKNCKQNMRKFCLKHICDKSCLKHDKSLHASMRMIVLIIITTKNTLWLKSSPTLPELSFGWQPLVPKINSTSQHFLYICRVRKGYLRNVRRTHSIHLTLKCEIFQIMFTLLLPQWLICIYILLCL